MASNVIRPAIAAVLMIALAPTVAAITPAEAGTAVAKAKTKVAERLIDPASAQFRSVAVYVGRAGEHYGLCGEVNARNRLGGYTGFVPFVAPAKSTRAWLRPDEGDTMPWYKRQADSCFTKVWP